jgi:UDP-N-acetylmuramate dehydrogenase
MNYTEIERSGRAGIAEALSAYGRALMGEPLSAHTSFRTCGPAAILFEPAGADELAAALGFFASEGIVPFVMGRGTNVVFADEGFPGAIICIGGGLSRVRVDGEILSAQAGALLSEAAAAAAKARLSGFEALSGIPGTVGGAVYMNAGAYGHEIRDIAASVSVYDAERREMAVVGAEHLEFSYRDSRLRRTGEIVIEAEFRLKPRSEADIREDMKDYARRRRDKQPTELPSAGSFFKRPPGGFAGKLIEDAGLAGLSCGGARISPLHSGFIVNEGGATASEILDLAEIARSIVFDRFGVLLHPEVCVIGNDV